MSMPQLVDILEAFGSQGLRGCGSVIDFILHRYKVNGGRISRRSTCRAVEALARLGDQRPDLLGVLLGELDGWMEQDPEAEDMQVRPAVVALWSLSALDLLPRAPGCVDWLLGFLCREEEMESLLRTRALATAFLEALYCIQHELPDVAARHLPSLGPLFAPTLALHTDVQAALEPLGAALQPRHTAAALLPAGAGGALPAAAHEEEEQQQRRARQRQQELQQLQQLQPQQHAFLHESLGGGGAAAAAPAAAAEGGGRRRARGRGGAEGGTAALGGGQRPLQPEEAEEVGFLDAGEEELLSAEELSPLQHLGLHWLRRPEATSPFSRSKQALGEVLSMLNISDMLSEASPGGLPEQGSSALAPEMGGFLPRWRADSPYEVDWAHPGLRIGVLVVKNRDFVRGGNQEEEAGRGGTLLAGSRLRVRHLSRVGGWRLALLREEAIHEQMGGSPRPGQRHRVGDLLTPRLWSQVQRANATHPLVASELLARQLQRSLGRRGQRFESQRQEGIEAEDDGKEKEEKEAEALAARVFTHLERQLEVVFPGSLVLGPWRSGRKRRESRGGRERSSGRPLQQQQQLEAVPVVRREEALLRADAIAPAREVGRPPGLLADGPGEWSGGDLRLEQKWVGWLLGRKGGLVREVESQTGATVRIDQSTKSMGYSTVRVSGDAASVEAAKLRITASLSKGAGTVELATGSATLPGVSEVMQIKQELVGWLVGKGGDVSGKIEAETGARLLIDQSTRTSGYSTLRILGRDAQQVQAAKQRVQQSLAKAAPQPRGAGGAGASRGPRSGPGRPWPSRGRTRSGEAQAAGDPGGRATRGVATWTPRARPPLPARGGGAGRGRAAAAVGPLVE